MQLDIADSIRNRAKNPHELFMLNLILFHLLLTPATLALDIGTWGLALTPACSLLVIAFIFIRTRHASEHAPWFIAAHWRMALRRSALLVIGYAVTATILLLAWLGAESTESIMFVAITRVGIMPTVILVFVTFVLESSGLYQAARGEVPDGLAKRFPPPPGT